MASSTTERDLPLVLRREVDRATLSYLQLESSVAHREILEVLYDEGSNLVLAPTDLWSRVSDRGKTTRYAYMRSLRQFQTDGIVFRGRIGALTTEGKKRIVYTLEELGMLYASILAGDAVVEDNDERDIMERLVKNNTWRRALVLMRGLEGRASGQVRRAIGGAVSSLLAEGLLRSEEKRIFFANDGRALADFLYTHQRTLSTQLLEEYDQWAATQNRKSK